MRDLDKFREAQRKTAAARKKETDRRLSQGSEAGQRFGEWTALDAVIYRDAHGAPTRSCQCSCGHKQMVRVVYLKEGNSLRCGTCARKAGAPSRLRRKQTQQAFYEAQGLRVGAVIDRWEILSQGEDLRWTCRCRGCGKEQVCHGQSLLPGASRAAGCRRCASMAATKFIELDGVKVSAADLAGATGVDPRLIRTWRKAGLTPEQMLRRSAQKRNNGE